MEDQCRRTSLPLCALLISQITYVYSVDYCTLDCGTDKKHTMCLYPEDKPAEATCTGYEARLITEKDKNDIVDWHNKQRNIVAGGNELQGAPGPQPSAANMMEVDWDDEIATIAQRWAYQCDFKHDDCRETADSSVGQNIAMRARSDKFLAEFEKCVMGWYDEVKDVNPSVVDSYDSSGPMIGHYTQIVSADTRYVGCGHVFYKDATTSMFTSLLVCNYKPAGNMRGAPLYAKGKPATQCPTDTKPSKTWENLCSTGQRKYGKNSGGSADKLSLYIILASSLFSTLKI